MKRIASLMFATACACMAADFTAVKADGKITLDGKFDEPSWQKALTFEKFIQHDSEKPGFPSKAMLLYDDDAIYLGFHSIMPEGGAPLTENVTHDSMVNRDDCVEIMLDPNKTNDRYFHFLVNSICTILDRYCDQGGFVGDGKWNSEATAGAFVGDGYWDVELRIPFSSLDIDPTGAKDWGLNICRECRRPNQESSIAPHGAFNVAGKFVSVSGIEIDANKYGWETSPVQLNCRGSNGTYILEVTTPISNMATVPQEVLVDLTLINGDNAIGASNKMTFTARESKNVAFTDLKVTKDGKYDCIVSILDAKTRKILKRRFYKIDVAASPFDITLKAPHYRNAIFATQNLKEVIYNLKCNEANAGKITTGIRTLDGKVLVQKTLQKDGEVRFPVADLPETKMEIFAQLDGGTPVVEPLRKLPYRKNEIWLDEQMHWRVDGKRFLMIGEWSDTHTPGTNASTSNPPDAMFICGNLMWSSFKAKNAYKHDIITPEEEQIIRAEVRKQKDNENLFAWYLMDEPEISNISAIGSLKAANIVRDEDPYHPLIVSNDTVNGAKDFAGVGEINGLHPYPTPAIRKPKSNFGRVVAFMDQAVGFNKGRIRPQTVAYLQQGFNYADHGASDSRIPTYDEMRTQFIMTQILGGHGMLFYNRNTQYYPEIYIGAPAVAKEMNALAPILLEDNVDNAVKVDNSNIRLLVKKHNGKLWIFALSTTEGKEKATFTAPELKNTKLGVFGEERTISANNGVFSDTFDNYQIHIYAVGDMPAIEPYASVEARIAQKNALRRKPGNLAFQEFEGDSIDISASSNGVAIRRPDCMLWHVTDGLFAAEKQYQKTMWVDNTPNAGPDWLELAFRKEQSVGKAVVYAFNNSLKDFEVQGFVNGNWKTLAAVKDGKDKVFTLTFPKVTTSKFRIYVTATNGPNAMVDEFELYEK